MTQPASNDDCLIECRDVHKTFRTKQGTIRVLEGVDLSVRRGEIVAITGRTGAGKSTLLGLLAGLDKPSAGTILLEGRRVDQLPSAQWAEIRRRKIGILFQDFNLLPSWTARENVEAAMLHSEAARPARRRRAEALLAACGLADRGGHLPSELSVGQQQLVAVARALANDPALLLADEPTGNLDPAAAAEIISKLAEPVRQHHVTLVVATHGTFPLDVADRALELADGALRPVEPASRPS